eukprot:6849400-Lingulodinium_polyedra.AAC.1
MVEGVAPQTIRASALACLPGAKGGSELARGGEAGSLGDLHQPGGLLLWSARHCPRAQAGCTMSA